MAHRLNGLTRIQGKRMCFFYRRLLHQFAITWVVQKKSGLIMDNHFVIILIADK
jgi:hypothetical protein